jgi:hypothetical protein
MLEVCWAFLLVWDVGHGVGCEVLCVQWLEYVMGWPAPSVVEWWMGCSVGKEMDGL